MQPRFSTRKGCVLGIAALALVASRIPSGSAGPPHQKARHEPLPKEIITAWKKAGAEVGWMWVDPLGFCEFLPQEGGRGR